MSSRECKFLFFFLLVFLSSQVFAEKNYRFVWNEAAKEVEHLPYSPEYIDSLNKEFGVVPLPHSRQQVPKHPFLNGETLVYEISWGPFKAGYVILTSEPDPANQIVRLSGKALSNNFISAFYKMRDYIISTVDYNGIYPVFFEQHLREGKKYKRDGFIVYDHSAGKLHIKSKKFKTIETPDIVHDYISVLYYTRTLNSSPGDKFKLNLYIHSKIHPLFFKCKKRKKIEVDAGTFNCIALEPKLVGKNGAFNKKDKIEVWLTDDEYKMPVLIKSRIKVGAISAKLVKYTRNTHPLPEEG